MICSGLRARSFSSRLPGIVRLDAAFLVQLLPLLLIRLEWQRAKSWCEARHHNNPVKERSPYKNVIMDASASSANTERRDVGRVAAKVANVVSDPFERVMLVYE